MMMPRLLIALNVTLLMTLAGCVTSARTIDVPKDHTTIQAAIDAASEGDVVVLARGRYAEMIDFRGKAITVRSTEPDDRSVVEATIIDGGKKGSVVTFSSGETSTSVLRGVSITGGCGTSHQGERWAHGGGIYCLHASPTISNTIIEGNTANCGAGICCEASSPTVIDNVIRGNNAWSGGGICCERASKASISGNTIAANAADTGGGIACSNGATPALKGNTIHDNVARNVGGGLYCDDGAPQPSTAPIIAGNSVRGNSAKLFGGGICCSACSPTITQNSIVENRARDGGGVACGPRANPAITNNVISRNVAEADGGGIYCTNISAPHIRNNSISRNAAGSGGGVYCVSGSSPMLWNTIIAFNEGGGLWVDATLLPAEPSKPVLSHCDVYRNTGGDYVSLPDQTGESGNISADPLFADASQDDLHLRSTGGRWDPFTRSWIIDAAHSPCIDAGDPAAAFAKEPTPNGNRINMGAFGGTGEASKAYRLSAGPTAPPDEGRGYYLRGVSNMIVEQDGETVTATTTDGTPASSKVHVGHEYTVMSERGGGRGGNVVRTVITKVQGRVANGRVTAYID